MRRGLIAAGAGGALVFAAIARRSLQRRRRRTFSGAVVAIVGGSRGLGLRLAREFGGRGARVAIGARNAASLEAARRELAAEGIETWARRCDARLRSDVEAFVAAAQQHYGRIDVLVNNAGTITVGPAATMEEADYADALATHFWGPYHAAKAALPALRSARGRLVNIVSIGGLISVPHLLPYCVSKFALLGYSLGLRAELASQGVSVTTICPGLMRTGSPRNAKFKGRNCAEYAWFALGDALPPFSISADAAARAIVDAAADRAPFVVLSLAAQLASLVQHLFPSALTRLLGIVTRALPSDGGIGVLTARGHQSESALTTSFLSGLSRRAEVDLNQREA